MTFTKPSTVLPHLIPGRRNKISLETFQSTYVFEIQSGNSLCQPLKSTVVTTYVCIMQEIPISDLYIHYVDSTESTCMFRWYLTTVPTKSIINSGETDMAFQTGRQCENATKQYHTHEKLEKIWSWLETSRRKINGFTYKDNGHVFIISKKWNRTVVFHRYNINEAHKLYKACHTAWLSFMTWHLHKVQGGRTDFTIILFSNEVWKLVRITQKTLGGHNSEFEYFFLSKNGTRCVEVMSISR
jgi:hypothetical protein